MTIPPPNLEYPAPFLEISRPFRDPAAHEAAGISIDSTPAGPLSVYPEENREEEEQESPAAFGVRQRSASLRAESGGSISLRGKASEASVAPVGAKRRIGPSSPRHTPHCHGNYAGQAFAAMSDSSELHDFSDPCKGPPGVGLS